MQLSSHPYVPHDLPIYQYKVSTSREIKLIKTVLLHVKTKHNGMSALKVSTAVEIPRSRSSICGHWPNPSFPLRIWLLMEKAVDKNYQK
jgi:hypothetical protein